MTIDFPASVRWAGFDLDDTLHHYRKASGRASAAVFEYLDEVFGCGSEQLQAAYAGILKEAQKVLQGFLLIRFEILQIRPAILLAKPFELNGLGVLRGRLLRVFAKVPQVSPLPAPAKGLESVLQRPYARQ